MVFEHQDGSSSRWKAIESIAARAVDQPLDASDVGAAPLRHPGSVRGHLLPSNTTRRRGCYPKTRGDLEPGAVNTVIRNHLSSLRPALGQIAQRNQLRHNYAARLKGGYWSVTKVMA